MIEEDFYCTLKLKYSGEEIFAKVAASDEGDRTMLLVSHTVVIEEVKMRNQCMGYKFEPWIKTSSEDMEMIHYYQDFIQKSNKRNRTKMSKKMGYIGNVNEVKGMLEKLYNNK